jgi:NAD(P)-dependent dehydrogenase (short-subunit alcohol dehydrogenase family)
MAVTLGFDAGDLVVVTGAGSGIGRATAQLLAEAGLAVACWDLNGETAADIAAAVDGTADTVDVTDAAQVASAFGRLGRAARYLVNNAGPASLSPITFAEGLVMGAGSMETVTGAWLASDPPAGAALVNVASVAGNVLGASPDWYAATKGAVGGWTRHLAVVHADRLRANAVAPGMIATPRSAGFADSAPLMAALARNPLHRMGEPSEIAGVIAFLLSPLANYVNGHLLVADGGWVIAP